MDLLKSISHPDEIKALLKYKLNGTAATIAKVNYVSRFIYLTSDKVFQTLPGKFRRFKDESRTSGRRDEIPSEKKKRHRNIHFDKSLCKAYPICKQLNKTNG